MLGTEHDCTCSQAPSSGTTMQERLEGARRGGRRRSAGTQAHGLCQYVKGAHALRALAKQIQQHHLSAISG